MKTFVHISVEISMIVTLIFVLMLTSAQAIISDSQIEGQTASNSNVPVQDRPAERIDLIKENGISVQLTLHTRPKEFSDPRKRWNQIYDSNHGLEGSVIITMERGTFTYGLHSITITNNDPGIGDRIQISTAMRDTNPLHDTMWTIELTDPTGTALNDLEVPSNLLALQWPERFVGVSDAFGGSMAYVDVSQATAAAVLSVAPTLVTIVLLSITGGILVALWVKFQKRIVWQPKFLTKF